MQLSEFDMARVGKKPTAAGGAPQLNSHSGTVIGARGILGKLEFVSPSAVLGKIVNEIIAVRR